MMTDAQAKRIADARIDWAMKKLQNENNNMGLFLVLDGLFGNELELSPDAGHNYYYLLEAVYNYYRNNPESGIDKYLFETFIKYARYSSTSDETIRWLNIIFAHFQNQAKGISSFEIKLLPILQELKNNIIKSKLINDMAYMNVINDFNNHFESSFGQKIL